MRGFLLSWCLSWLMVASTVTVGQLNAQTPEGQPIATDAAWGADLSRQLRRVTVSPRDPQALEVRVPRFAASLRSMHWEGQEESPDLRLKPEPEHWVISWKRPPAENARLVMEFDVPPLLPSETSPVAAAGDGSVYLPACLAETAGEKIRYEPQTYKNTVGYWTGAQDRAAWRFEIEQPGEFNVAILQGCGERQGGSQAALTIGQAEGAAVEVLEFEVLETGHFQNFQWVHLGRASLAKAGEYRLQIEPLQIKKGALMDVRAVHLVRLPER